MSDVRAEFFEDSGQAWLRAKIVGDPNELIRKANPQDAERWPLEWEAFQKGKETVDIGGTPLEDVPMLNRDIIMTLRMKGIRNAEELAGASDMAVSKLGMGGLDWRKQAQMYLATIEREAVKEVTKPKRGRPKKDDDE